MTATTNGWWGNIVDIARSAKQLPIFCKELDNCPHILKTFCNFHCYPKETFNEKLQVVFGALFSDWRYA